MCLSGILSCLLPFRFFFFPGRSNPLCPIFLQFFVAIPFYVVRSISLHFHSDFFYVDQRNAYGLMTDFGPRVLTTTKDMGHKNSLRAWYYTPNPLLLRLFFLPKVRGNNEGGTK